MEVLSAKRQKEEYYFLGFGALYHALISGGRLNNVFFLPKDQALVQAFDPVVDVFEKHKS